MPDFLKPCLRFRLNAGARRRSLPRDEAGTVTQARVPLYNPQLTEPPEKSCQRNPLACRAYLPGALIADRTALRNARRRWFRVSHSQSQRASHCPSDLASAQGKPPLTSDRPSLGLAHRVARRALSRECAHSRARDGVARHFSKREIEERLERNVRRGGESRASAPSRTMPRNCWADRLAAKSFGRPDILIGCFLGTRDAPLQSPRHRARRGLCYDPQRLDLFSAPFYGNWPGTRPVTRLERPTMAAFRSSKPISELHEGTEFAVDEAANIVFKAISPKPVPRRHDVLAPGRRF